MVQVPEADQAQLDASQLRVPAGGWAARHVFGRSFTCACAFRGDERLCLIQARHALLLLLLPLPQVWIPLKILQSISLWLVWRSGKSSSELALPLGLFGLHLFLGKPASFVVAGLQYQSCCH